MKKIFKGCKKALATFLVVVVCLFPKQSIGYENPKQEIIKCAVESQKTYDQVKREKRLEMIRVERLKELKKNMVRRQKERAEDELYKNSRPFN
jgi:hypothetical protein